MSWSETRQTMWDIILHRLGLVRQKHYDELCGRYQRLYGQYLHEREHNKVMLTRLREGGAI